jgi:hypothetical protein
MEKPMVVLTVDLLPQDYNTYNLQVERLLKITDKLILLLYMNQPVKK